MHSVSRFERNPQVNSLTYLRPRARNRKASQPTLFLHGTALFFARRATRRFPKGTVPRHGIVRAVYAQITFFSMRISWISGAHQQQHVAAQKGQDAKPPPAHAKRANRSALRSKNYAATLGGARFNHCTAEPANGV
jgi:hypothetical protein